MKDLHKKKKKNRTFKNNISKLDVNVNLPNNLNSNIYNENTNSISLGRDFNKNDFKVGQKIDISPKAPSNYVVRRFGWWENLAVVRVENSKLSWRGNNDKWPTKTFETNYNSIYS